MEDSTKLLLGAALVGGAVYLATRREKGPLLDDDGDEPPNVCGAVGKAGGSYYGAACALVSPVLGVLKDAVASVVKSCSSSSRGWYNDRYGFTGRCVLLGGQWQDGGGLWAAGPTDGRATSLKLAGWRTICCPPGTTDPKCAERRTATSGCVQGFGTVRDLRSTK